MALMISATRRCGGDDDDLCEQGFAKPSKVRGRGARRSSPGVVRLWCGDGGGRSPPGRGVRLGFKVEEVVRLGVLGAAALRVCRTPPLLTLNRWPARVRVGAGRPPFLGPQVESQVDSGLGLS